MATITKRNNSYFITVSCGYDLSGKQIRYTKTVIPPNNLTPKQAQKWVEKEAAVFEDDCNHGLVQNGNIKLEAFCSEWLKYKKNELKTRTYIRYKDMMPRIIKAMGHLRLDHINPQHLLSFYQSLYEEGARIDQKYKCTLDLNVYLKNNKMSRAELLRRTGVPSSTLAGLTQGHNCAKETAEKLSAGLNVPFTKLFSPAGGKTRLSDKTILNHHRLLSSMFSDAVMWGRINHNPCDRVRTPRVKKKEPKYLDEVEAAKLLDLLESERTDYKTIIRLLLYTGCRRGELLALHWDDVDFERNLLHFRQNLLYTSETGVYLDSTKNESSERVIKLSKTAVKDLRNYKVWQLEQELRMGDRWENTGFVFTNCETGKQIHPDALSSWFCNFIKAHRDELPNISLHSLRHTNATLQIAGGVALTTVAKRLGHADTVTTSRIYAHAIKSADEAAAETLEDILIPKNSKNNNTA